MLLRHQLPQVYSQLLPREILDFGPEETKATCDNCAMSRPQNKAKIHYRADLKCCTFHPFVPNYMIGAIFNDPQALRGQEILQGKIDRREYALPIGMIAPVKFQVEFNAREEGDFGLREDWLCPYYERSNGQCNIWQNRGVVCTTFFCKSSYGKVGLKFWDQLNSYLWYVENALMEESLAMLDFSPRQVMELLDYHNRQDGTAAEKKSSYLPEKKARELWNGYYDDQVGFYKKAFQVVANLDKKSFHEILGEQGLDLEEQIYALLPRLKKESSK